MLVLDSNTISPAVALRFHALRPAELGVPAIVEYELRYGLLRLPRDAMQPRMTALTELLHPMHRLPFDEQCAEHAARIRADLESAGTPIGPHDVLIAATALRHQSELVTRNVREFARVPGLRVQNWHDA
ncbi:MAG: type II toxin-antitoxin system VapC family toxin [Sandaracinaceae bacterium]|nr:type II toxin-antitoxin system VapC family toxin [Myxococcales bacterium]MCB9656020.1 type II toxin-antitoxin system VapC family toxin [Sandaracinaceae bacterium]